MKLRLSMIATLLIATLLYAAPVRADGPFLATAGVSFTNQQDASAGMFPVNYSYDAVDSTGKITREYPIQPGASLRIYYGPRMSGLEVDLSVGALGKYIKFDDQGLPKDASIRLTGAGVTGDGTGWWSDGLFHVFIDPTQIQPGRGLGQYKLEITYVGARRHEVVTVLVLNICVSAKNVSQTDNQANYLELVQYGGPQSWLGLLGYDRDCSRFAQDFGSVNTSEDIYSIIREADRMGYPGMGNLREKYPMAFSDVTKFDDGWQDASTDAIPATSSPSAQPEQSQGRKMTSQEVQSAIGSDVNSAPPLAVTGPQLSFSKDKAKGFLWIQSDTDLVVTRHEESPGTEEITEKVVAGPRGRLFGNRYSATFEVRTQGGMPLGDFDGNGNKISLGGS